ncbi:hypothetical protein M9H77_29384 [Catharanthus roseus]|uniref:Uncharacterized protein n=1 Tax=Catharanthus roseus TaxID=4058 RepID=A0ACC0AJ06_CATRO|nr:hypothetical protein M9H77_29384 [Catharanthus roseus]
MADREYETMRRVGVPAMTLTGLKGEFWFDGLNSVSSFCSVHVQSCVSKLAQSSHLDIEFYTMKLFAWY